MTGLKHQVRLCPKGEPTRDVERWYAVTPRVGECLNEEDSTYVVVDIEHDAATPGDVPVGPRLIAHTPDRPRAYRARGIGR